MKNKIITILKVALTLAICIVIALPFLKRQTLKQTKLNYLKNFVKLEGYEVSKDYKHSSARINLDISNRGDMLLANLPLDIAYLDGDRKILEKDSIDLLARTSDIIVAHQGKAFTIDVTYPEATEFIELEVNIRNTYQQR